MTTIDTKKIAREKVEKALAHIDKAVEQLSAACGELSPIIYADKQWELVGNHYDLLKELARTVSFTINREKVDLDSDEKRRIELKQKNTKSPSA